MSKKEVILEHRGAVTFDTINPLLDRLKVQAEFMKLRRGFQKRLYSVFVECIENIYKYESNDVDQFDNKEPYISLTKQEDMFIVRTGNIIANTRVTGLQSRLELINRQDYEKLRASYAKIIDQDIITKEEGAGLGLITIALRSQNRINYSFTTIDKNRSYFEMKILIENGC